MSKINTLELKFYPNIEYRLAEMTEKERKKVKIEYVSEKEARISTARGIYQVVRNFYEYYVDGKSVYNEISQYYSKPESKNLPSNFSYPEIGWIGAFDEVYDWVLMKDFLKENITKDELLKYFPAKKEHIENIIEYRENYEKDKYQTLYGCACGDEECGGLGTIITKESGFYIWTFGETENELQFRFEENQYRRAFQTALKEIRLKSKNK